jgi:hypothetical protein
MSAAAESRERGLKLRYPFGTRAQLAYELLLQASQSRCDVVRMGRQHMRQGMMSMRRQKTDVPFNVTIMPRLQTGISRAGSPLTITPSARSRFHSAHCARVLSKKSRRPVRAGGDVCVKARPQRGRRGREKANAPTSASGGVNVGQLVWLQGYAGASTAHWLHRDA